MYTDVAKHYLHDPCLEASLFCLLFENPIAAFSSLDTLLQRLSLDTEKVTHKDNL